ncbi:condensin-2 complex subunit D3 [Histomonas meleagridis]|uniref:condensin-2 complex subunit D3 n=1 Tax=Histomonas meleagridis TaxID=135588 RepID=UPI003559ADA1|nr:condensin-2 complex subunit D3 [Histomonas meleagridis]KAH0807187.1 condensin-2 complex subunit D3 [Histomonas meleagridis]
MNEKECVALSEEAIAILDQLGALNYSDDIIETVMRNQTIEPDESLINSIQVAEENPKLLIRLLEILTKFRSDENQGIFWDSLTNQDKSPSIFQPLVSGLISKKGDTRDMGIHLYVILLGMQPLNLLYNPIIFNSVLSIMITASQSIENPKVFDENDKRCILLIPKIFDALSYTISPTFTKLAGDDVIIAIIELAFKMSTIFRKELDPYKKQIIPASLKFINSASKFHLEFLLPYLVLTLLLDFLPPNKSITSRIVEIRTTFLNFCRDNLSNKPDLLTLVTKHIFVRCPDRVAIRESCAFCITFLVKLFEDKTDIINFIIKNSRAHKSTLRTLSLVLFKMLINDNDIELNDETQLSMIQHIFSAILDQVPNVRASSISAISALIPKADSKMCFELGLDDGRLLDHLEQRIIDEKLVVRKAALNCLKTICERTDHEPGFKLFPLIADRLRDRSVTMRQEAANILSSCLVSYHYAPQIVSLWFDSIFPLALDVDTKTQDLALKLMTNYYFSIISTSNGLEMTKCLNDTHIIPLTKVFIVYKQKAINLTPMIRDLERILKNETLPQIWKMADILISVCPDSFNNKLFIDQWQNRNNLPVEYLSIISKMKLNDEQIFNDSLKILEEIAEGFQQSELSPIHSHVQISTQKKSSQKDFVNLLNMSNNRINSVASDQNITRKTLRDLIPTIFLLGELVSYVKALGDYDFTGLQLLISEKLPNEIHIPSQVRSNTTISLGKLCLCRRDISSSFVAAFAHQLHHTNDPAVKCNCLIVLCDLCVKYSATVDPYIMDMSACFADKSSIVRRQALLILTRLISEDFIKMKPLIFFRFVYSLIDEDENVRKFAQSSLLDVLSLKDPKLLSSNFIDTLHYFAGNLDSSLLGEDKEFHKKFQIKDKKMRRDAYLIMIRRMDNTVLFELLQQLCVKVLNEFLEGNIELEDGEVLLSDTFDSMLNIENEMEAVNVTEANLDDPQKEKVAEQGRVYLALIHSHLIQRVLPILSQMHRFLRENKSPLQSDLRNFFRTLCKKHPKLLDELRRQEPILATELENEISLTSSPENEIPQPEIDIQKTPFRSPLLSMIAKTPTMTLLSPPSINSPIMVLSQNDNNDEPNRDEKRPPIPFDLDEDDD